MIIDSAIKTFLEKYDQSAIESIDEISKRYGLNINGYKMNVFNITEAFDKFKIYIEGYASYKAENVNNEKASPQDAIVERTNDFINTAVEIKDVSIGYKDIPSFVESYVSNIKALLETVDKVKTFMMESDVDPSAIGDINHFCDKFMERIDPVFEECMDRILWASGYNSKKALFEKKDDRKKEKHVFL